MRKFKQLDTILLIDDDDATNFINEILIEDCHLDTHIETCLSAEAGLKYLNSKVEINGKLKYPSPGVILLDINMPGMDGWEFLDEYEILPDERKGSIIIAMLSTSNNPEDIEKAKNHPRIEKIYSKPLKAEVLMQLIQENFTEEKIL